jgi:hypothetical protein
MKFLELPFASATILDTCLKSGGAAIQKYRHALSQNFDPGIQFSVGRAGTIRLNTIAAMDCVATAGRWKTSDAMELENAYKVAGMTQLVQSANYQAALDAVRDAVQIQVRKSRKTPSRANLAQHLTHCMAGLTYEDSPVRNVAFDLHGMVREVDARFQQMKRLPGRLVRNEGAESLIVVNNGEREELRTADSDYLEALGLSERGAPFVLHELRWSPDTTMSMYFPAVDLDETSADQELERQLKAAELPLPEPRKSAASH